jgi:hypothetical protein
MPLDDKGRCCGRKPMKYVGKYTLGGPHRFCPRCDRAYSLAATDQIENWAWAEIAPGVFSKRSEKQ